MTDFTGPGDLPLRALSGAALRSLIDPRQAIGAVRSAFIACRVGSIEQPVRMALAGGRALVMAAADVSGQFAVKAVTVRPEQRGTRPSIQGVVILFDAVTGAPRLLLDGPTLTALRTGAASGVATDLLAAPDASMLAVIGAGAQAWDQIRAVMSVRPIAAIRICSRSGQSAQRLRERTLTDFPDLDVEILDSPREAVVGAHVVCTVTTAREPLFGPRDLADDVHINALGVHTADAAELPPETFGDATEVAVDSMEAAQVEAGDLIRAIESGHLTWDRVREIGELLVSPHPRSGLTVFKSVGVAAQDLAVASLAARQVEAMERSPAGAAAGHGEDLVQAGVP